MCCAFQVKLEDTQFRVRGLQDDSGPRSGVYIRPVFLSNSKVQIGEVIKENPFSLCRDRNDLLDMSQIYTHMKDCIYSVFVLTSILTGASSVFL